MSSPRPRLPVTISRDDDGNYCVKLADLDITNHLAAVRGVSVDFEDGPHSVGGRPEPTITLRFVPRAVSLDLDLALIGYIRELDGQHAGRSND